MPPETHARLRSGLWQTTPAHPFPEGAVGQPEGPAARKENMSTLLSTALNASIIVVENGRRKKITKREAIVTQLVNKSAAADLKATQIVLAMLRDVECSGRRLR